MNNKIGEDSILLAPSNEEEEKDWTKQQPTPQQTQSVYTQLPTDFSRKAV